MIELSPPPFLTFSLNSAYLSNRGHDFINGRRGVFYIIVKTGQSNKPFRTAIAVLEVSFIHMLLDGHEVLLQHWEGAAQSSPLSDRKA